MSERPLTILTLFGTRPELIKLNPVLQELNRVGGFENIVVATAQHREMIDDLIGLFSVSPRHDLNIIQPNQSLSEISIRALSGLDPLLERYSPDLLLVQGDTTTAFIGALAAFHREVPVGHVEAGLRSMDRRQPFPEETNRRLISVVAEMHFAPTEQNARRLIAEGAEPAGVFVTGNTVIDSLLAVADRGGRDLDDFLPPEARHGRMILVTAHRRESFGRPLEQLCQALSSLAAAHADVQIVYPVHLNPNVRSTVFRMLRDRERIHLLDPLPYDVFVRAMAAAYLIITDSGGIQEEAPSLGTPVLVAREVTERTEVVEAGNARLVPPTSEALVREATLLLTDARTYRRMATRRHLYGDGQAGRRVVEAILHHFGRGKRPQPFRPEH